jgi:hypothetical protein
MIEGQTGFACHRFIHEVIGPCRVYRYIEPGRIWVKADTAIECGKAVPRRDFILTSVFPLTSMMGSHPGWGYESWECRPGTANTVFLTFN